MNRRRSSMVLLAALVSSGVLAPAAAQATPPESTAPQPAAQAPAAAGAQQALSRRQQSIAPIAATMAVGDLGPLNAALDQGLDAGLSISDAKEILVQLYAYTGFPRTPNALGELMKVVEARKQRGVQDLPGRDPGPVPTGRDLLALGTANQTKLIGSPVRGPLR